jgi:quercetin dioxygenase-like cupin family protein
LINVPVVEPFEPFLDERGEIRDLLRDENLNAVTLIRTRKGAIRGNHFHRATEQYCYMLDGRARWVTRRTGGQREEVVVGPGELYLTPAQSEHAMIAEEDCVFLVFTRGPRSGAGYETDTYRLDSPLLP